MSAPGCSRDYEASPAKPVFTPWQVAASEAFRDGNAAEAIAAYHARGHVHLCRRTEAALNQLADDWARYRFENPNKTAVALARTNLERQALSERMRQHHLPGTALSQTVTVRVSEGPHGKRTTPLDIAPGEHLRIGATLWDKQLYNGDIVVVQSLETHPHPGTHDDRLLITGHTLDGRAVTFHHDEIRDWHGNIRLSHGYALTFASAQGITVDHAFVLADEKPARETIYPAATRHRDGMDLYIDRRPLTLRHRRRNAPKTRPTNPSPTSTCSTTSPAGGRAAIPRRRRAIISAAPPNKAPNKAPNSLPAPAHPAPSPLPAIALDNTLSRIGRELRERALAYQHGPRITRLAAERTDVLERVEALRDRARSGETRVALTPEYSQAQKDLTGLLQRAAPYRGQPRKFDRLLATAGGITQKDLAALEDLHARASHHHRVASLDAAREKRHLAKLAVTKPQPLPALHTPDIQVPEPPRQTDTPPSPEDTAARLKRVLQTTKRPRAQDPAGRYLKHHALNLANATNLRFHPGAPVNQDGKTIELPALLAPVRTPDGTLEAVHRIYLTPDGAPAPIERQQHTERVAPRRRGLALQPRQSRTSRALSKHRGRTHRQPNTPHRRH